MNNAFLRPQPPKLGFVNPFLLYLAALIISEEIAAITAGVEIFACNLSVQTTVGMMGDGYYDHKTLFHQARLYHCNSSRLLKARHGFIGIWKVALGLGHFGQVIASIPLSSIATKLRGYCATRKNSP